MASNLNIDNYLPEARPRTRKRFYEGREEEGEEEEFKAEADTPNDN